MKGFDLEEWLRHPKLIKEKGFSHGKPFLIEHTILK